MTGMRALLLVFALLAVSAGRPAAAQTIYPLTRAEILAGSKFDLKVEFPGMPAPGRHQDHGERPRCGPGVRKAGDRGAQ